MRLPPIREVCFKERPSSRFIRRLNKIIQEGEKVVSSFISKARSRCHVTFWKHSPPVVLGVTLLVRMNYVCLKDRAGQRLEYAGNHAVFPPVISLTHNGCIDGDDGFFRRCWDTRKVYHSPHVLPSSGNTLSTSHATTPHHTRPIRMGLTGKTPLGSCCP